MNGGLPYKAVLQCCYMLLSVYFHKVPSLEQITAESKMNIFSGAVYGHFYCRLVTSKYGLKYLPSSLRFKNKNQT